MKIEKWVEFGQEIEIDINAEDISLILGESGTPKDVMWEINKIANYMKGIPEKLINELPDTTREVIKTFFKEQAKRFK